MKYKLCAGLVFLAFSVLATAQVASHAPTTQSTKALPSALSTNALHVTGKTVAKVNGAVLTDRDLLREMYALFPYAQQHKGFPKELEPQIRQGALQMIIFEELLYQEGKRRNITIPPARVASAMAELRKQFPDEATYKQFLKEEANGSLATMREKVRRSFVIESMLNTEIKKKAAVTPAQVRAYYDKNPAKFQRAESFKFQSISIIPPNDTPDVLKEVKRRAEDAIKQARNAKTYREFGLLAEKISEDDYRVNMGDHKQVDKDKLPPEIVKVASAMKPGQVSELIQLGSAYSIIRLEAHTPAGTTPFDEIKSKLQSDLENERTEKLRSALGKQLRAKAKIELM